MHRVFDEIISGCPNFFLFGKMTINGDETIFFLKKKKTNYLIWWCCSVKRTNQHGNYNYEIHLKNYLECIFNRYQSEMS